jgi:hypothetical protein
MNTRSSGISLIVAVGLTGITGLAFPEIAFASESDPSVTITVQVYNYSQASPAILSKAEREAGRILSKAGLQLVWLKCPVEPSAAGSQGLCQKTPEATDLRLRVLAAPIKNKVQDTVFGFAVNPTLASVYYDHAARLAKSDDAEFEAPTLLGCVIAHELGHLLLGTNSHSGKGIMQGRWGSNQFRQLMTGSLIFTTAQAQLMRAEARARMRLQAASGKDQRAITGDHQAETKLIPQSD